MLSGGKEAASLNSQSVSVRIFNGSFHMKLWLLAFARPCLAGKQRIHSQSTSDMGTSASRMHLFGAPESWPEQVNTALRLALGNDY